MLNISNFDREIVPVDFDCRALAAVLAAASAFTSVTHAERA
jgi:hypothetical protein